jgi:hypothetical protein
MYIQTFNIFHQNIIYLGLPRFFFGVKGLGTLYC